MLMDGSLEEEDYDYDEQLVKAIENDDRDQFISVLELHRDSYRRRHTRQLAAILDEVCTRPAINCAEALAGGQTPLTVDVNLPCCPNNTGMLPLHRVLYLNATNSATVPPITESLPSITELLLYYGARTDIRFNLSNNRPNLDHEEEKVVKLFDNMLPLQMALQGIFPKYYTWGWTAEESIYKLITILCLPRLQNQLETIAILAGTTKEFGEVFLEYAMEGKIVELACLLVAAPKEKLDHHLVGQVQQQCDSVVVGNNIEEDQRAKLLCVQRLLEVFDKAGDRISAYVKENKKMNVLKNDTCYNVKKILGQTGFHFVNSEVDLSDDPRFSGGAIKCYSVYSASGRYELKRALDDFGMVHYGKSGYRWEVSSKDQWLDMMNHEAYINELEREVKCLKEAKVKIEKKQQQLNLQIWMDDELWSTLEKDDKEEFLSILDRNVTFFRSRQQQMLYAVCCSGSIKCAEALIKGETPLKVDLNVPCTDTGLYPLHCAALSFFPSITELFLYHGAQTGIQFIPRNPSDVFPQHLLEVHANKLPLHMALHGISHLPCMREWTVRHSIAKLIALLCLPRMQNPLETLGLLAMTTKETAKEFLLLAKDGKFVELAALLTVANNKLAEVRYHAYDQYWSASPIDEDQIEINEAGKLLFGLFENIGDDIAAYVKEDKYDVSKYQVMQDVKSIIECDDPLIPPDTDLTVYNWYRIEESSYPLKAPYEYTSRSPDVGMEHYAKSTSRWRRLKRRCWWWDRPDYKTKLKRELAFLQREHCTTMEWLQQEVKPMTFGIPYFVRRGVPIASASFFFHHSVSADAKEKMNTESSNISPNHLHTRAMSSLASLPNLRCNHSRKLMLGPTFQRLICIIRP